MHVSNGVFYTYTAFLAVAGVVLLVVACLPLGQSRLGRGVGLVMGAGFLGYAVYLAFVFDGGTFEMFYYVFILPFVYIWRTVQAFVARRNAAARQGFAAGQAPLQAPGQPPAVPVVSTEPPVQQTPPSL